MGILDGVEFHREALTDRPADMSLRDYMYEVSIGTDYGVDMARDRLSVRGCRWTAAKWRLSCVI